MRLRLAFLLLSLLPVVGSAQAEDWVTKRVCYRGPAFDAAVTLVKESGAPRIGFFRLRSNLGATLADSNSSNTSKLADGVAFVVHEGGGTLHAREDSAVLVFPGQAEVTLTRNTCQADPARFPAPAPF